MRCLYESHSNVDEVTLNGFAFLLQNVIIKIYEHDLNTYLWTEFYIYPERCCQRYLIFFSVLSFQISSLVRDFQFL